MHDVTDKETARLCNACEATDDIIPQAEDNGGWVFYGASSNGHGNCTGCGERPRLGRLAVWARERPA